MTNTKIKVHDVAKGELVLFNFEENTPQVAIDPESIKEFLEENYEQLEEIANDLTETFTEYLAIDMEKREKIKGCIKRQYMDRLNSLNAVKKLLKNTFKELS